MVNCKNCGYVFDEGETALKMGNEYFCDADCLAISLGIEEVTIDGK